MACVGVVMLGGEEQGAEGTEREGGVGDAWGLEVERKGQEWERTRDVLDVLGRHCGPQVRGQRPVRPSWIADHSCLAFTGRGGEAHRPVQPCPAYI